jgi:C-terminal peptidase prc
MAAYFQDPETRFLKPEEVERYEGEVAGRFEGIGAVVRVREVVEPVTDPAMRHELEKLLTRYEKAGHELPDPESKVGLAGLGFTADSITKSFVYVVATVPGGPADQAGLLPGDRIQYVDGKWVVSYLPTLDLLESQTAYRNQRIKRSEYQKAVDELEKRLEGAKTPLETVDLLATATTPLKLTVQRAGAQAPLEISVSPAASKEAAASWDELGSEAGYLRVANFGPETPALVRSALNSLRSKGAKHLVLDLRNNALGGQAEMLEVLAPLMGSGPAALVETRRGKSELASLKASGERVLDGRLVVLVNGGTAGLAEVVAAALGEQGGARVVGAPTAGRPMAIGMISLSDGSAMRITTGKYLTSKGREFGQSGLTPDALLPDAVSVRPPDKDPAVKEAARMLASEVTGR